MNNEAGREFDAQVLLKEPSSKELFEVADKYMDGKIPVNIHKDSYVYAEKQANGTCEIKVEPVLHSEKSCAEIIKTVQMYANEEK